MNARSYGVGAACLLFATVAWGGLFHVGKALIAEVDPYSFTLIRYAIAVLLLVAVLALRAEFSFAELKRHGLRYWVFGSLGFAGFGIFVFVGLRLSDPTHGSVIMASTPFMAAVFAWVLDGRRPAPIGLLAIAVAFL